MIRAKHHPFARWVINRYFNWKSRWFFREILIEGEHPNPSQSVLLLQNHFSWWDGFWALYLSEYFFNKRFHVMMLEKQLLVRLFFNYCGAFSVRPQSREVLKSLRYAAGLLKDSKNLVCLFPQGEIQSQYVSRIRFKAGVGNILEQATAPVQVYFCVALVDYFSQPKPTLHLYLHKYFGDTSVEAMEEGYNQFREQCIEKQHE